MKSKPSAGWWASLLVYLALVPLMYFVGTPQIAGNALTEREERTFRVAAVNLKPQAKESKFAGYTLSSIKSGKVDRSAVSFLLPNEPIEIIQGDIPAWLVGVVINFFLGRRESSGDRQTARP